MRKVKVDWDTDNEIIDGLPEIVDIPDMIDNYDVADYLSDTYGFLVNGWTTID